MLLMVHNVFALQYHVEDHSFFFSLLPLHLQQKRETFLRQKVKARFAAIADSPVGF